MTQASAPFRWRHQNRNRALAGADCSGDPADRRRRVGLRGGEAVRDRAAPVDEARVGS